MFFALVLVGIFVCLILLSWIWPPDSPWSPRWRTSRKTAKAAFKLANLKRGETVYELGSGEAIALMVAAEEFGAKGVGVEIEPFRFALSSLSIRRRRLGNKVKLVRGNMFDVDLSSADVVYVYLVTKALTRLVPKFKKELRSGTRVVSYKYKFDLPVKKEDKENELRLYVI